MWGFKIYRKYERRCLEKVRTLWWHFACNRYKYFEFDYLIFIVDLIVLLSRAILQIFSILFLLYFSLYCITVKILKHYTTITLPKVPKIIKPSPIHLSIQHSTRRFLHPSFHLNIPHFSLSPTRVLFPHI